MILRLQTPEGSGPEISSLRQPKAGGLGLPKGSNVEGWYIIIPKKKIGQNQKGTTLEPLGILQMIPIRATVR